MKDVVDIDQWQQIQDHFAETIGVTMRTVDHKGNLLTTPSEATRFCVEVIGSSPVGLARCGRCLPPSMGDLELDKWKEGYLCHIGLHNFFIPVMVLNNKVIAYILVGPVLLGERKKPGQYRRKAEELGIDLDRFIDGLIEIKLFTFTGIQSTIELLQNVASYIAQLGYQRSRLERIVPWLPKVGERFNGFYIDRLLNALLDVAFDATGAELGSVMLLDEKTDELYIKIGRGLKKDIIRDTRLKMGEGIAGLAAQERSFLLVDDKLTDERIKSRLRRPEIKSAMVLPIQVKDKLFGVMNIGTTATPSDKFNPQNLELLSQLGKLVSIALTDLSIT